MAAFFLTRTLGAFLFDVSPLDPSALGAVALLAFVALLACGIPALTATRIDPAAALRSE